LGGKEIKVRASSSLFFARCYELPYAYYAVTAMDMVIRCAQEQNYLYNDIRINPVTCITRKSETTGITMRKYF